MTFNKITLPSTEAVDELLTLFANAVLKKNITLSRGDVADDILIHCPSKVTDRLTDEVRQESPWNMMTL